MDEKGHQFQSIAKIQDHWKERTEIPNGKGKIRAANGTERNNIMTRGWEVMVLWKYGSMDCIKVKEFKDSNPVEVAEYDVANRIQY